MQRERGARDSMRSARASNLRNSFCDVSAYSERLRAAWDKRISARVSGFFLEWVRNLMWHRPSSLLHAFTSRKPQPFSYIRPAPSRPLYPPRRPFLRSLAMYNAKTQPKGPSKVLVFGAGNFGSCLASHLGDSQHDVYIWAREERIVTHFNKYHRNAAYLKDHVFPESITAVGPALPSEEFMENMDVLLFAIPTQFLR